MQCYFLPQGIMGNKGRKHTIHPPMSNPLRQSILGSISLDFHHASLFLCHGCWFGSEMCSVFFIMISILFYFTAAFAALLVFARTAISYSISISLG